jgi:hypothetical protein
MGNLMAYTEEEAGVSDEFKRQSGKSEQGKSS